VDSEVRDEIRSVVTDVLDKGGASWQACADAGLLGLAAPEEYAGEGLGLGEIGVLLHEIGVRALDLPAWETLACGLMTLVKTGTPEQQARFVPDIVAGKLHLAPALDEPGVAMPPHPRTALVDGRVTGHKIGVTELD
jgi:alkylation response protein AidB-like acyl-CoA dehydrogenase